MRPFARDVIVAVLAKLDRKQLDEVATLVVKELGKRVARSIAC